jgi:DNA polymerase III subunit gamma/tau
MSSVTLYRKYRPQSFAEIVNQDHIKTTVQQELLTDNLPHAFLFHGPRGVGKTTTARVLAKALNCAKRKDNESEPCNKCDSCVSVTDGKSLNLVEVDAASQTGVDNVRENIIANARVAVKGDEYKVFIIDEVHMLSTSSFNALLKTLEEPPERVLFILATTEIHKIPDTIISRCQRFDFHPVKADILKDHLASIAKKEKREVEEAVLQSIVVKSAGHVRDAISLLGQVLSLPDKKITAKNASLILPVTNIEHVVSFFSCIAQSQAKEAMVLLDDLEKQGIRIRHYCDSLIDFAHDLLLYTVGSHPDVFTSKVSDSQLKEITDLASSFTAARLMHVLDVLIKRRHQLKDYNRGKLPLELAVIELIGQGNGQGATPAQAPAAPVAPAPVAPPPVAAPVPPTPVAPPPAPTPPPVAPSVPITQNMGKAEIKIKEKLAEAKAEQDPVVLESVPVELTGDNATYSDFDSRWGDFMKALSGKSHSLFIILRTIELREGKNSIPLLAFRFKMHHDHVLRSVASLNEAGKEIFPTKDIQFQLTVDENMDYASGSDVVEPKKEEKEELAAELTELADAFGGSVME